MLLGLLLCIIASIIFYFLIEKSPKSNERDKALNEQIKKDMQLFEDNEDLDENGEPW